jgi:hypothetical protein
MQVTSAKGDLGQEKRGTAFHSQLFRLSQQTIGFLVLPVPILDSGSYDERSNLYLGKTGIARECFGKKSQGIIVLALDEKDFWLEEKESMVPEGARLAVPLAETLRGEPAGQFKISGIESFARVLEQRLGCRGPASAGSQ